MAKHKTITHPIDKGLVRDFIKTARSNGITYLNIADRELANELKTYQSRGGKVVGRDILAWGNDELGNVIALTTDRVVISID
jgi:hypothetical protein